MAQISTHVLDTSTGEPVVGLAVVLRRVGADAVGRGTTDANGRIAELAANRPLAEGIYALVFDTGAWYAARNVATLYPTVTIHFRIDAVPEADSAGGTGTGLHLPLLLSPFGYSTYRGR